METIIRSQASQHGQPGIEATPPRSVEQLLDQAEAILDSGDIESAEPIFREALAEQPSSRAHMGLARCAHLLGDLHRSLGHLHAVQRVHPMYPRLANDLGVIYFKLGLTRAAVDQLEMASEQAPDDPLPLQNLVDVAIANGDLDACCEYARRLIAIDSTDEEARALVETLG
ncbi:MAG: tetratricopeptide repeat protein [Myxococcales bacterium]|nr:tetratricopeptide repeat protein [Myxococcales bacterium]